jgi:ATP-dependent Clp protease ATP-binding subunit ClpA
MAQKPPLDRFTDSAQMALFQARAAAAEHGGAAITDAHLLLGLLRAAPELGPLLRPAVNFQRLSECLIGSLGPPFLPAGGELPFAPGADAILREATRVADSFNERDVTPADMFLALLERPATVSRGCLSSGGLDIAATTSAVRTFARGGK